MRTVRSIDSASMATITTAPCSRRRGDNTVRADLAVTVFE